MIINGVITIAGFFVDIFGIFDLSLLPAVLGLMLGVIDCVTFFWMREEIREIIRRWRANREVILQRWYEEMEGRKPRVVVRVAGHTVVSRVVKLGLQLGYELAESSELPSHLGTTYVLTFERSANAHDRSRSTRQVGVAPRSIPHNSLFVRPPNTPPV